MAGGLRNRSKNTLDFTLVNPNGDFIKLDHLPHRLHDFPMAISELDSRAFILGGVLDSRSQIKSKALCSYSIRKNDWTSLPSYPEGLSGNSLCVHKNQWLLSLECNYSSNFKRIALSARTMKWEGLQLESE